MKPVVLLVLAASASFADLRILYRPDPTHFVCSHCSLAEFVQAAFGIRSDQLSGPAFLNTQLVDATAGIPPGATEEQYQQILRDLLERRLGLAVHHEQKTIPALELVVLEGAPKQPGDPFGLMPKLNAASPDIPSGKRVPSMSMRLENGVVSIDGNTTYAALANALSNQFRKRIKDSTGVEGKHAFALTWRLESPNELSAALSRLGLALRPTTLPVDTIVVDHINKKLK